MKNQWFKPQMHLVLGTFLILLLTTVNTQAQIDLVAVSTSKSQANWCKGDTLKLIVNEPYLVGYFPLHGTAYNHVAGGFDGEKMNTPPANGFNGLQGGALYFDPRRKGWVSVPNYDAINLTQQMMISFWYYHVKQKNGGYKSLVEKSNPDDGGHSRYGAWVYKGGVINACIEPSNCPNGGPCQQCLDSKESLKENEWSHIVVGYDGQQLKIYVNGNLSSSNMLNFATGISTTSYELMFGHDKYDGGGTYLTGRLDEIRVYDQMLSDAAIKDLSSDRQTNYGFMKGDEEALLNVGALYYVIEEEGKVSVLDGQKKKSSYDIVFNNQCLKSIKASDGSNSSSNSTPDKSEILSINTEVSKASPVAFDIISNTGRLITLKRLAGRHQKAEVIVFNVHGKKIIQKKAIQSSEIQLQFNSFGQGLYFISLHSAGEKHTKKVIIE